MRARSPDDPAVLDWSIARRRNQFHAEHAILAAEQGKHVDPGKADRPHRSPTATASIAAVESRRRSTLIVWPTPMRSIRRLRRMRGLIASGRTGRARHDRVVELQPISSIGPRRPEELDTSKGGGILFNQVPHQIDTVRLLGGGL